ncbi:MAG TPA: transcription elongation factor GreA [Chloroflexi bacterium]|nr:transcription elongation factor GreA [Chloroflexota bacterium]
MEMSTEPVYMTEKGRQKIQDQLDHLYNVVRPEYAELLHEAREGGDSIDNTEYIYLVEEMASIEAWIRELEHMLDHAELIQPGAPTGQVQLGSTVLIQENGGVPESYTIVGSTEANPEEGLISNKSPLGRTLLNHRVGEDVTADTPDGKLTFRIIAVT